MSANPTLRGEISAVIAERQPVSATEIAAVLDVHPRTVQRHCQQLQQAGQVQQVAGDTYVPTGSVPGEPRASD